MLCEQCKKRTATVFYNENINGKTNSFSLCGECAAKIRDKGEIREITSMVHSFADPFCSVHDSLFHDFFGFPMGGRKTEDKKCPTCGTTFQTISQNGKAGCADCYTAFRQEFDSLITSLHGSTLHRGEAPCRQRAHLERVQKMDQIKKDMQELIRQENFEQAAFLRDELKKLQSEDTREGESHGMV